MHSSSHKAATNAISLLTLHNIYNILRIATQPSRNVVELPIRTALVVTWHSSNSALVVISVELPAIPRFLAAD